MYASVNDMSILCPLEHADLLESYLRQRHYYQMR